MLSAIVFAATGIWILVFMFVLALCRDAKAGDEALDVTFAQPRVSYGDRVVVELVRQRGRDARQIA